MGQTVLIYCLRRKGERCKHTQRSVEPQKTKTWNLYVVCVHCVCVLTGYAHNTPQSHNTIAHTLIHTQKKNHHVISKSD